MYSSAPPVAIEVEKRPAQDVLRASAVATAQNLYAIPQADLNKFEGDPSINHSQKRRRKSAS